MLRTIALVFALALVDGCGAPPIRGVQSSVVSTDGSVWYSVIEDRNGGVVAIFRCTPASCSRLELR